MHRTSRINHRLAFALFLAPDTGGGTGGGGKTLEQQLTSARDDLAAAQSLAAAVPARTAERDAAQANAANLQAQFDALTATATKANTDLATANTTVGTLTAERDGLKTTGATKDSRIKNLESLCGVKGINPDAAPPALAEQAGEKHAYDQWASATGAEKSRLWSAHRDEIRAEGERRSKRP